MLYLVCGYPASGKTTYCRRCVQQSAGHSIVFDMDAMRQAITCTGTHDQRMSRGIGRLLNDTAALFSTMYRQYGIEDMYLIRMVPREDELERLARIDDMRIIFMDVPKETCRARAELRGDYDLYAFGGHVEMLTNSYMRTKRYALSLDLNHEAAVHCISPRYPPPY